MTMYELVRTRGSAAELHDRGLPEPLVASIWSHEVTTPALVLGSAQHRSIVDERVVRARGIDLVRRRSGGGAVLLVPDEVTWIDVVVPASTRDWVADVHEQMVWLGNRLARAIGNVIGPGAAIEVHAGPTVVSPWSKTICFDGVGPGEVLIDGSKLVGISQRRTRQAARLQACWYSAYDAAALVELLHPDARPAPADLRPVATLERAHSRRIVAGLGELLGEKSGAHGEIVGEDG